MQLVNAGTNVAAGEREIFVSVTDDGGAVSTVAASSVTVLPADVITGTEAGETLSGRDGNDAIDARDGDDTVFAGDGDDLVLGGLGDDILAGGAGTRLHPVTLAVRPAAPAAIP